MKVRTQKRARVLSDQLITTVFASINLSPPERIQSVSEREAQAYLFACEKWHVCVWSRHFTLHTDDKPLDTLPSFGSGSHRPLHCSRWCAILVYYNFTLQYCKHSHIFVVDALSPLRLKLPACPDLKEEIVSLIAKLT